VKTKCHPHETPVSTKSLTIQQSIVDDKCIAPPGAFAHPATAAATSLVQDIDTNATTSSGKKE
jgi:hypothetical protein